MPLLTPYQDHDLADIVALVNSAYRGELATKGWTSESDLLSGQRTDEATLRADLVAKPGSTILTMRDTAADQPHACAWLEPTDNGAWYVGMVTVSPLRQDGGLGRAMLDACEAHAKAQGAQRMRMTVISVRDTLIAWYQRRGYQRTGETLPFPYGDERFGQPQRDDLAFIVLEKTL